MIEFDHNQLILLAKGKVNECQYEEALRIILQAPSSPETRHIEHEIRSVLGKKAIAEGEFQTGYDYFKSCTGSTVNIEIRRIAQIRCKLIKAILDNPSLGVTAFQELYPSAKVKDVSNFSPESLMPVIWYVGSSAAYRSNYDPESRDDLSTLIRRIKHTAEDDTLLRLGKILASFLFLDTPILMKADYIVPVPTSPDRWDRRGYQIPDRLAEEISVSCAIPISKGLLETVGDIPELRGLPRRQRARAIAGSYKVAKHEDIEGKSFVIVDDIITTGSTVTEIARILLESGAVEVAAISLAYTERSY